MVQQQDRGRRLFQLRAYSKDWPEPKWIDEFRDIYLHCLYSMCFLVFFMVLITNLGEFAFVYTFIEWWRELIWLSIGGGLFLAVVIAGVSVTGGKESKFGSQFEIRSQGFEYIVQSDEVIDPINPPFYRWNRVKRIE
jgi:hypothetical protein